MHMILKRAFADFLRARRARLNPADYGLPERDRRVSGLRRQEFAELAGLSVEYYTKLEQGRAVRPSPSVLTSIAQVMRLDRAERTFLWHVAQLEDRQMDDEDGTPVPIPLQQLLKTLSDVAPSFVLTPATDIVARNAAGAAVFGDQPHNVAARLFLDPSMRERYGEWETVARQQVAWLRFDMVEHFAERRLPELIEHILDRSETFARMWDLQEVERRSHGRRIFHHPEAGTLSMSYTALPLPADPRLTLVTWSAAENSDTADRLQKLVANADPSAPVLLDPSYTSRCGHGADMLGHPESSLSTGKRSPGL